jgi:ParB family chromosome partitioning protein
MRDELYSESIFFIDVQKIVPNPYQPRREFDQAKLKELSESIRQYGVLQPLVVTRVEQTREDGGLETQYELIAGERRLRASKLAGLSQVPAVIRKEQDPMMKLELAIIENLQREDLNPIDRARAFLRLVEEFGFSHKEIGKKVGRSREYVSNSLRLLQMPQKILDALGEKRLSEGHTRPLLMLNDRPEEQDVLFKEILYKKITVREAERLARNVAKDKVRKHELLPDPEVERMEKELQESLGTRVHISKKQKGGSITIDYFSQDDLRTILDILEGKRPPAENPNAMMERFIAQAKQQESQSMEQASPISEQPDAIQEPKTIEETGSVEQVVESIGQTGEEADSVPDDVEKEMESDIDFLDDSTEDDDEEMYNISNFSL